MSHSLFKEHPGVSGILNPRSLGRVREGEHGVDRPKPGEGVGGGEGKEAREVKWARANLLMGSK